MLSSKVIRVDRLGNAFSKTPLLIYLGAWMTGADLMSRRLLTYALCTALVWAGLYLFNEIMDRVREEGRPIDHLAVILFIPSLAALVYMIRESEAGIIVLAMVVGQLMYTFWLKPFVWPLLVIRVGAFPVLRLMVGMSLGENMVGLWGLFVAAVCALHLSSVLYTLLQSETKRRKLGYQVIDQSFARIIGFLTILLSASAVLVLMVKGVLPQSIWCWLVAVSVHGIFLHLWSKKMPKLEKERRGWSYLGLLMVPFYIVLWNIANH